ncbi:MAG TPA: hypothetical protein VGC21_06655 [Telluria sp.]|jgi:hypothetical protein
MVFAAGVSTVDPGMYGKWEGELRRHYFKAGDADPAIPAQIMEYKLDIIKGALISHTRQADGEFGASSLFSEFDFNCTRDFVSGQIFRTSAYESGKWEESQSVLIHKVSENVLAMYWLRVVNNIDEAPDKPLRKWALVSTGTLRRIPAAASTKPAE